MFNLHFLYSSLRLLFIVGSVFLGFLACYYLSTLTYPFIIAICTAFLINPIVNAFERIGKLPRGLAVFLSITILFSLIAGILTLLIAEIVSGSTYLAKVVPSHFEKLIVYLETLFANQIIPLYNQLTNMFNNLESNQQESIVSNIENVGERIASSVGEFIKSFLENIPAIISWLPDAATVIVFSLLATFFISKDWYKFKAALQTVLPAKAKKSGRTVLKELKKALIGFIRAQATLISITAIIVLIGLLVLRVDYAITIAMIIGLVDLLPYLGTGLIFLPWIIYLALSGNIPLSISLGVLYIVVLLQRQIMEPKVLSSSIGLDPLATLVALFIGFKLIGFLGLILGPVVLVVLKTLHEAGVYRDTWNFIVEKRD
ncbi:sporulation integral membrane protein YtvI [Metabacillus herbersteinensis]|uniref:Sporulation integral membrane protein YtvI n=1 Tax=Metabacillus herbersteinensis TaxID=283816 RepID=A0ABV6G9C6_9BACI